jgi:hypothetical protein
MKILSPEEWIFENNIESNYYDGVVSGEYAYPYDELIKAIKGYSDYVLKMTEQPEEGSKLSRYSLDTVCNNFTQNKNNTSATICINCGYELREHF